jgi:hypothetical protein
MLMVSGRGIRSLGQQVRPPALFQPDLKQFPAEIEGQELSLPAGRGER